MFLSTGCLSLLLSLADEFAEDQLLTQLPGRVQEVEPPNSTLYYDWVIFRNPWGDTYFLDPPGGLGEASPATQAS